MVEIDSTSNHGAHSKRKVQFTNVSVSTGVNNNDFDTTKVALTPALHRINPEYRNPEERAAQNVAPPSSISRPNYEDILRRVSIVIMQHIQKCELRQSIATPETFETGTFRLSQVAKFQEENFMSPEYVYHFVRAPLTRIGFLYGVRRKDNTVRKPTVSDIHTFLRDLFTKGMLSAECSIVCLIYIERLMEAANVPLLTKTWKPILLCGLLLASKVWQDLSSWNIEFSQIYPQFSLQAINKLEALYCNELKWNLYISSSNYAKYYFALRSLTEKSDFRRNYNAMLVNAPGAQHVAERSVDVRQMVDTNWSRSY